MSSISSVQQGTPACSLPSIKVIKKIKENESEYCNNEPHTQDSNDILKVPDTVETFDVWLTSFRRLLKSSFKDSSYINEIPSRDLIHSVSGLVSIALPNMDNDTIYSTLTDKKAVTLLVFRDREDALNDLIKRNQLKNKRKEIRLKKEPKKKRESDSSESEDSDEAIANLITSGKFDVADGEKDIYASEEEIEGDFCHIYSDSDSDETTEESASDVNEDGSSETTEDEEEFAIGYNSFVKFCLLRKQNQRRNFETADKSCLGPENLLVATATFESKYIDHVKVLHLTLIITRPSMRKKGIGSQLINILKDPTITGDYYAIVVHADSGAIDFFKRHGFSDDYILNKRWEEIAGDYTDCTLMTYMAGFSRMSRSCNLADSTLCELDLNQMEREMEEWRRKEEQAHIGQVQLFRQMKEEIMNLRASLASQNDIIKYLMKELRHAANEKSNVESELLSSKYQQLKLTLSESLNDTTSRDISGNGDTSRTSADKNKSPVHSVEPVHTQVACPDHELSHSLSSAEFQRLATIGSTFEKLLNTDPRCQGHYKVTKVVPALLSEKKRKDFKSLKSKVPYKNIASMELYFCGTQEKPNRIQEILSQGFTDHDLKQSSYGKGLYFAPFPTTAALFSVTGQIILAEVLIGTVAKGDDVSKTMPNRTGPPEGFQSILVPGRSRLTSLDSERQNSSSSNQTDKKKSVKSPKSKKQHLNTKELEQEYVVYSPSQALPIALIEYKFSD